MGENHSKNNNREKGKRKKDPQKKSGKFQSHEYDDEDDKEENEKNIIDTYEIYDKKDNKIVKRNIEEDDDADSLGNQNLKPKEIKLIEPKVCSILNVFFNDYKCTKCFLSIIIQISRNKDDNLLYITAKCINNHIETKTLSKFLKENKFIIGKDFKIYNYFEEKYEYDDEFFFICFKCKKIYDIRERQINFFKHKHETFKYVVSGKAEHLKDYGNSKHCFELKDQFYLDKKVNEEKKYLETLTNLLKENKLKEKYDSYLKKTADEIDFFCFYYLSCMKRDATLQNARRFQNLSSVFNHTLIPFKLDDKDININNLNLDIQKLNDKLSHVYSENTFNYKEKTTTSNYQKFHLNTEDESYVSYYIPLDMPYFAAIGRTVYIYKKDVNLKEKTKVLELVSKVTELDSLLSYPCFLGNKTIICGNDTTYIIKFDKDYKTYKIIKKSLHEGVRKVMNLNNNEILLLGYKSISKYSFDEETNFKKILFIDYDEEDITKKVRNICLMNKNYFAYLTKQCIHIIDVNTFKEEKKIEYENKSGDYFIKKYNDKLIALMTDDGYQIFFYNIETGNKEFELVDDNFKAIDFIKTKREENEIILIASKYPKQKYKKDMKREKEKERRLMENDDSGDYITFKKIDYGSEDSGDNNREEEEEENEINSEDSYNKNHKIELVIDLSLNDNKWISTSLFIIDYDSSLGNLLELDDKTIIIAGSNDIHLLVHPSKAFDKELIINKRDYEDDDNIYLKN